HVKPAAESSAILSTRCRSPSSSTLFPYTTLFRSGGNNDAQQVPMVMALIEAGFADHLMFSADASGGYAKTMTVFLPKLKAAGMRDRKSTRLNSSHDQISYAVFCLKKKNNIHLHTL